MPALKVSTPACQALVHLHGAQVAQWQPNGQAPVIWLSERSWMSPDKPIRGGIPVIFPWFGPSAAGRSLPAHGFARLATWKLYGAELDENGTARLLLGLDGDECTMLPGAQDYPDDFTLRLQINLGAKLSVALTVTAGAHPLRYEEALHTYLSVAEARQLRITGLEHAAYFDKVGQREAVQMGELQITGETDRVFEHSGETKIEICDEISARTLKIGKTGSRTTVVWNPGADRARALPDLGDQEWRSMICVEAANIGEHAIQLTPGQSHKITQTIKVVPIR